VNVDQNIDQSKALRQRSKQWNPQIKMARNSHMLTNTRT